MEISRDRRKGDHFSFVPDLGFGRRDLFQVAQRIKNIPEKSDLDFLPLRLNILEQLRQIPTMRNHFRLGVGQIRLIKIHRARTLFEFLIHQRPVRQKPAGIRLVFAQKNIRFHHTVQHFNAGQTVHTRTASVCFIIRFIKMAHRKRMFFKTALVDHLLTLKVDIHVHDRHIFVVRHPFVPVLTGKDSVQDLELLILLLRIGGCVPDCFRKIFHVKLLHKLTCRHFQFAEHRIHFPGRVFAVTDRLHGETAELQCRFHATVLAVHDPIEPARQIVQRLDQNARPVAVRHGKTDPLRHLGKIFLYFLILLQTVILRQQLKPPLVRRRHPVIHTGCQPFPRLDRRGVEDLLTSHPAFTFCIVRYRRHHIPSDFPEGIQPIPFQHRLQRLIPINDRFTFHLPPSLPPFIPPSTVHSAFRLPHSEFNLPEWFFCCRCPVPCSRQGSSDSVRSSGQLVSVLPVRRSGLLSHWNCWSSVSDPGPAAVRLFLVCFP